MKRKTKKINENKRKCKKKIRKLEQNKEYQNRKANKKERRVILMVCPSLQRYGRSQVRINMSD